MSTKKNVLDLTLMEVSKRFISIKDDDFKKSKEIFKTVFDEVKKKMEDKCNFFKTYSSQVLYGGSVADGIKVSKLDEFDMDIVIRLPINYDNGLDGIIIENDQPGFVKMKIINAFDNLDKQQHWESRHKVTRDWRDSDKYFLQNKFRNWLQGIVQKTINDMNMQAEVDGVKYLLKYKESGPAYTLNIRNEVGNEPFALDVDIVPVIKFSTPRWPSGYRRIKGFEAKDWLVVPKPNKYSPDGKIKNRCWRLSFQDFEREMIKGCQTLKSSIRLVKKLRDALGMKAIASYYIKTIFLWKVDRHGKEYWQNKLSVVFRDMVQEFYDAVNIKKIPYFWQEENNLIENLKPTLQRLYTTKLKGVLDVLVANDVEAVVAAILTHDEHTEFKKIEFYQKVVAKPVSIDSGISIDLSEQIISLKEDIEAHRDRMDKDEFNSLEMKVLDLSDRVTVIEDRLKRIEMQMLEDRRERLEIKKNYIKLMNNVHVVGIKNGIMNLATAYVGTLAADAVRCPKSGGEPRCQPEVLKTRKTITKTSLKAVMEAIQINSQKNGNSHRSDQDDSSITAPCKNTSLVVKKGLTGSPASSKSCRFCYRVCESFIGLVSHESKCRFLYGSDSENESFSDVCP